MAGFRKVCGDEDSRTLTIINGMGLLLAQMGKYAEAERHLREALEIRQRVFGDEHYGTLATLSSLGSVLVTLGRYSEAEHYQREAVDGCRRVLGVDHPNTLTTVNNLGWLLEKMGRYEEAATYFRDVLQTRRRILGDDHPRTLTSINNMAFVLERMGAYAEAEGYYHEVLDRRRHVLGEDNPNTLTSLNNLAGLLDDMGRFAEAEAYRREVLAGRRRALGDDHPEVASSLHNLAYVLHVRGDDTAAEQLYREALAMKRRLLGDEHPDVALSLTSLALLLKQKGDYEAAEPIYREALALRRKLLGDEHPDVAATLHNLASLLAAKGDYDAAEPLLREALAMRRRLLGPDHPDVVYSLNNLAGLLRDRGDSEAAEHLLREALAVIRESARREHTDTVRSLMNLAILLKDNGEYAEAETLLIEAAELFEKARLHASASGGLERAKLRGTPLTALAAVQAYLDRPAAAFQHLEAHFARGVLDEIAFRQARPLTKTERETEQNMVGRFGRLDERIAVMRAKPATSERDALLDTLERERETLKAELIRFNLTMRERHGPTAGEVRELSQIQREIPIDAALVAWLDVNSTALANSAGDEHWACVVRHQGTPAWVKLPGSGEDGAWTKADSQLLPQLRNALSQVGGGTAAAREELIQRVYAQRIAPIQPHLAGGAARPPVKQLIILPAGVMSPIPIEVLTDEYTVSYAPSGTMHAWLVEKRRQDTEPGKQQGRRSLLALGDPAFPQRDKHADAESEPPEYGVLVASVLPGSNAERGGLRAGDVVLSYDGQQLATARDLGPAIKSAAQRRAAPGEHSDAGDQASAAATEVAPARVPVQVWRDGQTRSLSVAPGKVGLRVSRQPVADAVNARHRLARALAVRGESYAPLPASRREVAAVAKLFEGLPATEPPTILLGAAASEHKLEELSNSGELQTYRVLHFATHGVMDDQVSMRSALLLAQDEPSDSPATAPADRRVYDNRLTADQIARNWKLDADLVTLSACQTALGKAGGGEGFLGFSQALFAAGARSLVLSLWKVDDTATALLMTRFYENLLGRFDTPRAVAGRTYDAGAAMPKAAALREAKHWLRCATRAEVRELQSSGPLAMSVGGPAVERGTEVAHQRPPEPDDAVHPYEHPYYWSAFVLYGDPD